MSVISNPVSNNLSKILKSRACRFTPASNQHPQFLRNAVVVAVRKGAFQKAPLTAVFVWGLRRTRTTGSVIAPEKVRRVVKEAFPSGGSVVLQLGWWDGMNEDAARVTVENSGKDRLPEVLFKARVDALLKRIITDYGQEVVWLDYFRGTKTISSRAYEWK